MEVITKLKIIIQRLKAYDTEKRVSELLKMDEIQQAIINVIQERIYKEGRLATGEKLITDAARYQPGQAAYSRFNKEKRNFRHVTLYVTGRFYEQMTLNVGAKVTRLTAPFVKEVHKNFQDTFSTTKEMLDELGTLTEEEIDIISKRVIMPYIHEDLKIILNVQK